MENSQKLAFAEGHYTARINGKEASWKNPYCQEDERHAAWEAGFEARVSGITLHSNWDKLYSDDCLNVVTLKSRSSD